MSSNDLLAQTPILSDADSAAALRALTGGDASPQGGAVVADTPPADTTPPAQESEDLRAYTVERERIETELAAIEMSPEVRWKRSVEAAGMTTDEAQVILDTIIVQLRPYQKTISNGKVTVVLRTRTQQDEMRLVQVLERLAPKYDRTVAMEDIRYKLAGALVRYNDREFSNKTLEDLNQTLAWLSSIPLPAFIMLHGMLVDFDNKVLAAFSDGYLQNF